MIATQTRISCDEALQMLQSSDLISLGEQAHEARLQWCRPEVVTYIVDRNVNYSNVCAATCYFCAFYRKINHEEAYVLPIEEILGKIGELKEVDGTQVLLQGGLHPKLGLEYYTTLLSSIKARYNVHIHGFSAPEIHFFMKKTKLPLEKILRELQAAGLDTIPGGGAEILSDRVRRAMTKGKCMTQEWLDVHEAAHTIGMKTTATMMFGSIETLEERIEHFHHIRELQDRTGGFTAFIPWTFQASNTEMADVPESGAVDYLRTLAVSRLFLDNVPNIQASFITQGKSVGQMALFYGANDMGGTMMEENVVAATGIHNCSHEKEIQKLVADAGFTAKKRNTLYEYLN